MQTVMKWATRGLVAVAFAAAMTLGSAELVAQQQDCAGYCYTLNCSYLCPSGVGKCDLLHHCCVCASQT